MKLNKKALSAAIALSLVLGVYGVAGATGTADKLFGVGNDGKTPSTTVVNITPEYAATTTQSDAGTTGANYTVTGGTWSWVIGGYSDSSGNATGNEVNISGGTISTYIDGGYSKSGDVSNNTVTISGTASITAEVDGGYSDSGNATGNKVNISGGTISKYVYGDTISGYVCGGASSSGAASSNSVTIGGTASITGDVYGGVVYEGSGAASSNSVTISGGTIGTADQKVTVYGGYSGSGAVKNNTVKISGTANLTNAALYGYNTSGTHTDNTLTIDSNWNGGNNTVKSIHNFDTVTNNGTLILAAKSTNIGELTSTGTLGFKAVGNEATSATISGTLNFYISKTTVDANTMLRVVGTVDLTGATIQAGIQAGSKLKQGDKVYLIKANTITGAPASKTIMTNVGFKKYELGISIDDNDLVATILKSSAD